MPTIKSYQNQREKEQIATQYFLNQGYSPEAVAGIVGNLVYESGLNTKARGDIGFKGGDSYGIAQFRGQRLKNLKNRYGDKWTDFSNQLDFVRHELETTHKKAGNALKNAQNSYDAGRVFSDLYEIPAKKYKDNTARQKQVNRIYSTLGSTPISDAAIANVNNYFSTLTPSQSPEIILDSPVTEEIPAEKEDEDIKEVKKQTAEYNFLRDYQQILNTPQQTVVEEPVQESYTPMVNLQDIFTNVSNFVDTPYAQQGRMIVNNPRLTVKDNIYSNKPDILYLDEAKNFTVDYINSPKYRERLIRSGYADPDKVIEERLKNFNNLRNEYQSGIPTFVEKKYYDFIGKKYNPEGGSAYLTNSNTIISDPLTDSKIPNFFGVGTEGVRAHELGHTEIAKVKLNKKENNALLERQIQPDENDETPLTVQDIHDFDPNENKSDLNALRFLLKKQGIYDAGKEDFTKEHLRKMKPNFIKNRLLKVYKEKDLIWLMNNIADASQPNTNTYAQEGLKIGNLTPEQTEDVENARQWTNYWNQNREIGGKKININSDIPFSSEIYIDDLNYGNNNRETTLGEFDTVSDRLILDTNYQSKAGIPVHELTHRYQKYLNPEIYNNYINQPISTALKETQGSSEYHGNIDENQAELNRLRYNAGFKPNQVITPKDLENYNAEDYNLKHFSQDQLINLLNTTAYNDYSDATFAQEGGLPVSSDGVYKYPGQNVIVPTKNGKITMQNVGYPILGIDEYGNKQMMMPGQEYQFKGKTITEIPQLKDNEKEFLKYISKL